MQVAMIHREPEVQVIQIMKGEVELKLAAMVAPDQVGGELQGQ